MEAEYMALSDASRKLLAHLTFFNSISMEITHPTLFTDNEAAEAIVKHEPDYQRSKHIDICYHFVRDHSECGTFNCLARERPEFPLCFTSEKTSHSPIGVDCHT
jgi:hypothetical protein